MFRTRSKKFTKSVIVEFEIDKKNVKKIICYPIIVENGIPKIPKSEEAKLVLLHLEKISGLGKIYENLLHIEN